MTGETGAISIHPKCGSVPALNSVSPSEKPDMAIQESWARARGWGFLGSVGVLLGGTGIAGAISALMLPVLTRLYTPQDFSLLAVLTSAIAIVSVAACLRFDMAIPLPEQDAEAANVLGLAILSLAGVVVLLSALLLVVPVS